MLLVELKINASRPFLWEALRIVIRQFVSITVLGLLWAGCQDPVRFYDSFEISVNSRMGPLMVAATLNDDEAPKATVIDTLSPLSLIHI